ncbi:MAG: formyltetrahydrofolate deformylase [Deltaproteobacteria bacterium]|nr:formyltetrahydrofolate deformylase [Deltaproteobacteria bacterium]MBW2393386.1 formyltetrahydrofolate deformylase [Deltaproteobacteria bacterium]
MSPAPETATLIVTCPDRRGIVASLAQVLHGHGGNILDADQHTDVGAGQFFQRIRVDLAELTSDRTSFEGAIAEVAERFHMEWHITWPGDKKRVAIFVSRYDHCLWDLLLRHRAGEFDCEIVAVMSNHPDLEPISTQFGVGHHVFPITKDTKSDQERRERELLDGLGVDLIVLARYMQVLSGEFVAAYPNRIINIHHSFLPAFMGGKPYHQAFDRGVKLIGATAHYATTDLDEGPIIEQAVVRTSHRDSVKDLLRKGRDVERMVLAKAVRNHLEDRVIACANKTVVFE